MTAEQKQRPRIQIRWMIRRDMSDVLEIENEGFEFPWSEEDFIRCLRQRNCIGMVAEQDDRVVAFMIYELHKTRLHLLNFAVAADTRRQGIGHQMMDKLLEQIVPPTAHADRSGSPRNQPGGASLLSRPRLSRVSVLRNFYDDTTEDAYLMQFRWKPAPQEIVIPTNRITKLAG